MENTQTQVQTSSEREPIDTITDDELKKLTRVRGLLKGARLAAKELEAEEKELEAFLIEKVKANAVFTGKLRAIIDIDKGRCSPSWKDEYIIHFCAEHGGTRTIIEEAMKAKYPAKPSEALVVADERK